MTVPYIKFMKHAEKITKKVPGSRPILQGVHHQTDGGVVVTDSHRLYKAYDAYNADEPFTINPKTGDPIEGNYPETDILIPNNEGEFVVKVNVDQALNVAKAMKIVVKENDDGPNNLAHIVSENGTLYFVAGNDSSPIQMKYIVGDVDVDRGDMKMAVNNDFLLEALEFLKDVGLEQVNFNFYDTLRPFTFTADGVVALILPIREGN